MSVYSECGHEYHGNHCAKCAREAGAQQERAKIVAYLRRTFGFDSEAADEVEAGEHLK